MTTMKAREMVAMWLRDRASDCRKYARKAREAYTKEPLDSLCSHYADAQERAAAIYEEAIATLPVQPEASDSKRKESV